MKKILSLLLALCMALALLPGAAFASSTAHFSDVPAGNWAFPYVERAYSDGVITGTGGDPARGTGQFSPSMTLTYGQFYTILARAFYSEELARVKQPADPWYAPALRVALNHGLSIFSETQLTQMANQPVDRYNAAFITVRLMQHKGVVMPGSQEQDAAAAEIGDWDAVVAKGSTWHYFVAAAYAAGIITGVDSNGTFDGDGTIRRDSAAAIYMRLADKLAQTQAALHQEYQIVYGEGWDMLPYPGSYREELEHQFYEAFPRIWTRWGNENLNKTLLVYVYNDPSDTAWMRASARRDENGFMAPFVMISARANIDSPGRAFPHELGHTVQGEYGWFQSSWWTQDMADYASFRYYVWADAANMDVDTRFYYQRNAQGPRNWNYETGPECVWFFAYMDSKYPTTSQGCGLIDSIHNEIINGQITSDDINDPTLNAVVKRVTGLSTIDQVRQQFVRELDAGTWTFNGFADYADNYITENIPGVPTPTYPTAADFNLCTGAYMYDKPSGSSGDNLVDGDLSSLWQTSTEKGGLIALEKPVTFNIYTLYHAGGRQNTVSWILRYYDSETEEWKVLDEVTGNTQNVTTRTVPTVTTRHLWLEILDPSGTGDGAVRLYELELYDRR